MTQMLGLLLFTLESKEGVPLLRRTTESWREGTVGDVTDVQGNRAADHQERA